MRFTSAMKRDAWADLKYSDSDSHALPLTRAEAERWYPAAFRDGATWERVTDGPMYDADFNGEVYHGAPTGGIYTDIY
jgi:hypothetical protein